MREYVNPAAVARLILGTAPPFAYAQGSGSTRAVIAPILASGEWIGVPFALLASLSFAALVFLCLRELWCWYWKINEAIGLLKEIRDGLKHMSTKGTSFRQESSEEDLSTTTCPKCGTRYQGNLRGQFCEDCGGPL